MAKRVTNNPDPPPLAAHHEAALKAAGVDWKSLKWAQTVTLIEALLATLAGQTAAPQPKAKNPPAAPPAAPAATPAEPATPAPAPTATP